MKPLALRNVQPCGYIQFFNRNRSHVSALLNLPLDVMNEVIKLMEPFEQIPFALLSKKMNTCVICSGSQIADHCEVNFTDGNAVLKIPEVVEYSRKEISNWNDKTSIFSNFWPVNQKKLISNTMKLIEKVQMVFPKRTFSLTLHSNDLKNNDILDALLNKTWKKVTVNGGELRAEDLDKVMEMDNLKKNFVFKNTSFPPNYRHKNAFKFASIEYDDALWVQIDDLLTLTDNQIVRLGQTSFKSQDLNLLLKTWQRSPHDMFEVLTLRNNELNLEETFKDLVTLTVDYRFYQNHHSVYLRVDNSNNHRDLPNLTANISGPIIQMSAYNYEELMDEPRIMKNLIRKKSLEDELATLNEGSARKDEINAEIENVMALLTPHEIYFEDGKAKTRGTKQSAVYMITLYFKRFRAQRRV
ncbi:hypothetical protein CRE_28872 [Caenorhabditis remanei]|uniref:Uncharacterized protein n=1 Tax=Caenorhabditis remanei TaxID=31234 RepID=E3MXA8_CAERE|nr:hypothetical protein CRE_28872 [Caenorhabditis remanei]